MEAILPGGTPNRRDVMLNCHSSLIELQVVSNRRSSIVGKTSGGRRTDRGVVALDGRSPRRCDFLLRIAIVFLTTEVIGGRGDEGIGDPERSHRYWQSGSRRPTATRPTTDSLIGSGTHRFRQSESVSTPSLCTRIAGDQQTQLELAGRDDIYRHTLLELAPGSLRLVGEERPRSRPTGRLGGQGPSRVCPANASRSS